jgi:hypothetical protein
VENKLAGLTDVISKLSYSINQPLKLLFISEKGVAYGRWNFIIHFAIIE